MIHRLFRSLGCGACVAALALGACSTDAAPPPTADAPAEPVALVLAWWEARNAFDYDAMARLMAGDALHNPFGSAEEVAAARALNRVVTPLDCEVGTENASLGTFISCEVSVSDIIVAAAGVTSRNLNRATFRVRDGRIIAVPVWIPSSQVAEAAIETWARAHRPLEYQRTCPQGIAGQSSIDGAACARFIARNQAGWSGRVASLGLDS